MQTGHCAIAREIEPRRRRGPTEARCQDFVDFLTVITGFAHHARCFDAVNSGSSRRPDRISSLPVLAQCAFGAERPVRRLWLCRNHSSPRRTPPGVNPAEERQRLQVVKGDRVGGGATKAAR